MTIGQNTYEIRPSSIVESLRDRLFNADEAQTEEESIEHRQAKKQYPPNNIRSNNATNQRRNNRTYHFCHLNPAKKHGPSNWVLIVILKGCKYNCSSGLSYSLQNTCCNKSDKCRCTRTCSCADCQRKDKS